MTLMLISSKQDYSKSLLTQLTLNSIGRSILTFAIFVSLSIFFAVYQGKTDNKMKPVNIPENACSMTITNQNITVINSNPQNKDRQPLFEKNSIKDIMIGVSALTFPKLQKLPDQSPKFTVLRIRIVNNKDQAFNYQVNYNDVPELMNILNKYNYPLYKL